jgi:hypothetical protein
MSAIRAAGIRRYPPDHFEPQLEDDPHQQRRLKGQLEQIDYIAFAANTEVLGRAVRNVDLQAFQRLAVAAAEARAAWVSAALTLSEAPHAATPDRVVRVAQLRSTFEELSQAYDGLRRMVERGYVAYRAAPTA